MGGNLAESYMPTTGSILSSVAAVMAGFNAPWFIAGGWAIDLYLARVTRPHNDVEIAVLRKDQSVLYAHFNGWLRQKIVAGERVPWQGEELQLPIHEIHCFNGAAEPQQLEVLLNEAENDAWVFRRNQAVRRPLRRSYFTTAAGLRVLSPEIVLLYKSKQPRRKDEQDFAAVVGQLAAEQRAWLHAALVTCDAKHVWLASL